MHTGKSISVARLNSKLLVKTHWTSCILNGSIGPSFEAQGLWSSRIEEKPSDSKGGVDRLCICMCQAPLKSFFFGLLLPYPQWTFLGAASRAHHPDASWSLCRPEHTERWKKEGKEGHTRKKARRQRQVGWIVIMQTGREPNSSHFFTADASFETTIELKVTNSKITLRHLS